VRLVKRYGFEETQTVKLRENHFFILRNEYDDSKRKDDAGCKIYSNDLVWKNVQGPKNKVYISQEPLDIKTMGYLSNMHQ